MRSQARKLNFSHTRRSQTGEIGICAFEENRVGPFGAIPACFPFYGRRSGLTDFVDGTTQTVRSCRLPFGKPSLDDELPLSGGADSDERIVDVRRRVILFIRSSKWMGKVRAGVSGPGVGAGRTV